MPPQEQKYRQLLDDGFCVYEGILDARMLTDLREKTDRLLEIQSAEDRAQQRTTGSMVPIVCDPFFADVIIWPKALEALSELGFRTPTFSDGYIISKPPHSPRLFWHYDWFAWEDPRSYEPVPPQVFLMYYLSDTRPENGCLRAIPGSHRNHNPLHDMIDNPHSRALAQGDNLGAVEFSNRPDEIDVLIRAGALLIGDARLLHATHANDTDQKRTLLTLWYQPDLRSLPDRMQAQMAAKAQHVPESWPEDARRKVEGILAYYSGSAEPYERTLYRKKPYRS
jgi:ectoine hydroxylase-related dioxygenase (phytanoyl-CoA dioxygenase family)